MIDSGMCFNLAHLPLQPGNGESELAQQIPTLSLLDGVFLNSPLQPKSPQPETEHLLTGKGLYIFIYK